MSCVKWMRIIGALMLAFLWSPLTVHCQLESLPGMAFLACGDPGEDECCRPVAPIEDSNCESDACAAIESGAYKTEIHELDLNAPASDAVDSSTLSLCADSAPRAVALLPFCSAPPELPAAWQFHSRTALPPRAPSLVS